MLTRGHNQIPLSLALQCLAFRTPNCFLLFVFLSLSHVGQHLSPFFQKERKDTNTTVKNTPIKEIKVPEKGSEKGGPYSKSSLTSRLPYNGDTC